MNIRKNELNDYPKRDIIAMLPLLKRILELYESVENEENELIIKRYADYFKK